MPPLTAPRFHGNYHESQLRKFSTIAVLCRTGLLAHSRICKSPAPTQYKAIPPRPRLRIRISSRSGKTPTLTFRFSSLQKPSTRSFNSPEASWPLTGSPRMASSSEPQLAHVRLNGQSELLSPTNYSNFVHEQNDYGRQRDPDRQCVASEEVQGHARPAEA